MVGARQERGRGEGKRHAVGHDLIIWSGDAHLPPPPQPLRTPSPSPVTGLRPLESALKGRERGSGGRGRVGSRKGEKREKARRERGRERGDGLVKEGDGLWGKVDRGVDRNVDG